jgi:F-type H+-transporting ATPase subunit epsilon
MSDALRLTVLTPERKLLDAMSIKELTLQSSEGEIQVLPGHAAMLGTLVTGRIKYHLANGDEREGVVSSGFFEVSGDLVSVVAETLELRGEIDLDRARKAQLKSEAILKEASIEDGQFQKYQLKLQRALIRQQVEGKSN